MDPIFFAKIRIIIIITMKNGEKKYKTFTFFIVVVSKTYLLRRKSYHS